MKIKPPSKPPKKRTVINSPTGSGKSTAAVLISAQLLNNNTVSRVLLIVPTLRIGTQFMDTINKTPECREQLGKHPDDPFIIGDRYLIISIQTYLKNRKMLDALLCEWRLLIMIDEAHRYSLRSAWGKCLVTLLESSGFHLFLTATPERTDKAPTVMSKLSADCAEAQPIELSMRQAVNDNVCVSITHLCFDGHIKVRNSDTETEEARPTEYTIETQKAGEAPTTFNFSDESGENFMGLITKPYFDKDGIQRPHPYASAMIDCGIRLLAAVKKLMPQAGGLVIASSMKQADVFATYLNQIKPGSAVTVHSGTENPQAVIERFAGSTDIDWIVSVGMIREGVDIPRLRVEVYLSNQQTRLAYTQSAGRICRLYEGAVHSPGYVIYPPTRKLNHIAQNYENSPDVRHCFTTSEFGLNAIQTDTDSETSAKKGNAITGTDDGATNCDSSEKPASDIATDQTQCMDDSRGSLSKATDERVIIGGAGAVNGAFIRGEHVGLPELPERDQTLKEALKAQDEKNAHTAANSDEHHLRMLAEAIRKIF